MKDGTISTPFKIRKRFMMGPAFIPNNIAMAGILLM